MPLDSEIIVVSGLPRSGTSLMAQMLDRGGVPVLADEHRPADLDNPLGYYEFEGVKRTADDSWVSQARGKAVKVVSPLLFGLPAGERYRILFMQRDLDEVLASQEAMLARRGKPVSPREDAKAAFAAHLRRVSAWLEVQPHMRVLRIGYRDLLTDPHRQAVLIREFLDGFPDVDRMQTAIDPRLYRNRAADLCPPNRGAS